MFKSIYWNINKTCWEILDDDFEEISNERRSFTAIVKIYEKRNLNVAANLVLFFKSQPMTAWPVSKQIEVFAKAEKELYTKYKNDIEKYLSLI